MAAQQPIAFAFNRTLVGRTLDVLIDAPAPEGKNLWVGRTYADAPDVDGLTYVRGSGPGARRPRRLRDRRARGLRPGRPADRRAPPAAAPGPAQAAEEAVGLADHPGRHAMNRAQNAGSMADGPRRTSRGSGTSPTR